MNLQFRPEWAGDSVPSSAFRLPLVSLQLFENFKVDCCDYLGDWFKLSEET